MLPARKMAEELLQEAEICNPGSWVNHSRVAAHCAECIAAECDDLDSNKAYILGSYSILCSYAAFSSITSFDMLLKSDDSK